jgi:ABC-2 type transport system permease protein
VRASLVIAAREYRQLTRMSSFWIALLFVPIAILASGLVATRVRPQPKTAFVLIDRAGGYRAAIEDLLAAEGLKRSFVAAPLPADLSRDASPAAIGAALAQRLGGGIDTTRGRRVLVAAVYIPQHVGAPDRPVRIWIAGEAARPLVAAVSEAVARGLRQQAIERRGIDPQSAARLAALAAPIDIVAPTATSGAGGGVAAMPFVVPIVLDYLLVLVVGLSGSWILQAMIEERANKLLEAVLACVSARELMHGKLLGSGAAGLTIAAVWIGVALAAIFLLPGSFAATLAGALAAFASPLLVLALVFYFLCGYLVAAMLFLAIGATTDSMQNVQGYLMPVVMLLIVPLMVLFNSMLADPHGILPVVMSWIPVYTPFAMLARLGVGVSPLEAVGTAAMLIAFLALEVTALGRVFRTSLLRSGQPPRLAALARLMLARERD